MLPTHEPDDNAALIFKEIMKIRAAFEKMDPKIRRRLVFAAQLLSSLHYISKGRLVVFNLFYSLSKRNSKCPFWGLTSFLCMCCESET